MAENAIGEAFIALRASFDEFRKEMGKVQQEVEKAVAPAQKKFQALGKSMSDIGGQLALKVTAPLTAVGVAAFKAGDTIDDAMDTIRTGTGATGEALKALGNDFKAVFAKVPQDAGQVSTAIADLNTRLGLTGQPLQELTTQMLNLARISGTEVAPLIASTTRLFGDWSVATEKQGDTLDYLWKVSQSTGIGVDTLVQKMVQFGAPLRQMGFGFEEAAALMGKWEKEGVNSELVLGSLRIAMGNFARENIPLREGLDQTIKKIQSLGPGAEATALAMEVFGARAGPDMAAAILEGRFAVDELLQSIQASPETVNSASDDIKGFGEAMGEMRNQVILALEPLGKTLLDAFEKLKPHLESAIGFVARLVEGFANLSPGMQTAIIAVAGIAAALGPLMMIFGPLVSVIGSVVGAIGAMSAAAAGGATGIGILTTAFPGLGAAFAVITGPIGIAIAAIAGVIAIGMLLRAHWDEITTWLTTTWQAISNAATTIWTTITSYLLGAWNSIATTAQNVWNSIKAFFFEWWETLLVVFTGPLGVLALLIIKNWDDIQAFTMEVWNSITQFFAATWDAIQGIFAPPIQWIIDTLSNAWATVSNVVTNVWNGIKSFLSNTWASIKQMFIAAFSSMVESAGSFGRRIMEALKNAIGSVRLPIPSFSISFSEGPLGVKIPNIDFGVNWRALRDIVPFLADGGIVTRPTLAVLGEAGREAVVPLDRGGYGTINITITGNTIANDYDVDRIADKLVRRLRLAGVKV